MPKLIILVGISGAGKSTWATNYISENKSTIRVNRDDLRKTLIGKLTPDQYKRKDVFRIELLISSVEDGILHAAKDNSYNAVIDNTNLKKEHIEHYINEYETEDFAFKFFDMDVPTARMRVIDRDEITPAQVQYVDKQHKQYEQIKEWIIETYPDKILE